MPIKRIESSDPSPKNISGLSKVERTPEIVKKTKVDTSTPLQIDPEIHVMALEKFDAISKTCRLLAIAEMPIPKVTKEVPGISSGNYLKWVQASAKATQKEIEIERSETRLRKSRQAIKERLHENLKKIREKGPDAPPAA